MRSGSAVLILGLAACRAAPEAERPSPIRVAADTTGRRQVRIETVDGAWKWRLRLPERVFCDEAILVGHDFRRVFTPVEWRTGSDGSVSYRRKNADDTDKKPAVRVDYEVKVAPRPYGVEILLSFTNTGSRPLTNLTGHICLGHLTDPFRDPGHERAYIRSGGRFVNLHETDRGENPIRTHYGVKGKPVIKLFTTSTRFWGRLSSQEADNGLILTRSRDGKTLIALWFDPAGELFQNSDENNMCIHSDPHYGSLAPGERREVRGKLILFRGGLEDFERTYLRK